MCGIVGIASGYSNGFSPTELDTFKELLFLDTVRGWDSTGVFGVTYHNNVHIAKDAVTGGEFVRTQEYKNLHSDMLMTGIFMVGHNRAATRGTVKPENAHPFWVDDKIILVQNGTYFGNHQHHKNTEVDTEAIAHVIAEEDDIAKALNKINASYALVWYNVHNKTLNLIRNEYRPLFVARTKHGGMLWASEGDMLAYVAGRNKLALKDKPYQIKPHTLVSLDLDTKQKTWGLTNNDLKLERPKSYTHHTNMACGYGTMDDTDNIPWVNHGRCWNQSKATTTTSYIPVGQAVLETCPMYAMSNEEAEAVVAELKEARTKNVLIQLIDFCKASNSPSAQSYYMFGLILSPTMEDTSVPKPVVYWTEIVKNEGEILDLVSDEFFEVSLGTPVTYRQGAASIVTLYAFDRVHRNITILTDKVEATEHAPTH